MNIRRTKFYKNLTSYQATGLAEGFVEPDEGKEEEQTLAAWQWLHDTRQAYSLQGWFGRQAQNLIAEGQIEE